MEEHEYRALWRDVSPGRLLCLGKPKPLPRHVTRTGEIKDFIVLEESGIAKGVRRIVAVTGHEAAEAHRQADYLTAKLDRIVGMSGTTKDAGLKSYTVVRHQSSAHLDNATMYTICRSLDKPISRCSENLNFVIDWQPSAKHLTRRLRSENPWPIKL